jgi:hypothetical protein
MIDLWQYHVELKTKAIFAGVRRETLKEFVKRCAPNAMLTDKNGEEWVLRYIREELGCTKDSIKWVDVIPKSYTAG